MPWCPKCKSEYVEGMTECADCKVPLVKDLPVDEEEQEIVSQVEVPIIEVADDGTEDIEKPGLAVKYENYHDKAENFKSSAYTLIFVGVLGIIALILIQFGVLPIHLNGSGKYLTNIVMGALFIIFIVVGMMSFQSSKKYEQMAVEEDDMTAQIKKWISENIDTEEIKRMESAKQPDLAEEMKYFLYSASLKRKLTSAFPSAREEYLDNLIEELYPELFE